MAKKRRARGTRQVFAGSTLSTRQPQKKTKAKPTKFLGSSLKKKALKGGVRFKSMGGVTRVDFNRKHPRRKDGKFRSK